MGSTLKSIAKVAMPISLQQSIGAAEGYKKGGIGGALKGGALAPIKNPLDAVGLNLEGEEGSSYNPNLSQTDAYNQYANAFGSEMDRADKGVQESGLTKDVYGAGGLQSQLAKEQGDLSSRGFSLQQPDYEAFGQASGDISRQFGQQEQDVANSLARRGLGGASSGAAGAAFSGLAGNKNEMLAKAQTDIAQKRMADTQQRLLQTRQMMTNLASQGSGLAQDRYNSKGGSLATSAGLQNQGNALQRQAYQDKEANYKPGLMESLGQGLQAGVVNLASKAPSIGLGAATGGAYGTASLQQQTDAQARSRSLFG